MPTRARLADDTLRDQQMMTLALRLGRRGDPSPNPHVGAVVAKGARIVGKGFHPRAGEAHAEVRALAEAGQAARGATLYVTLEPCNHRGRTGPCIDAIIAAGIARVVFGCADPSGHARGGQRRLKAAGIEVTGGVQVDAARALVADFAKHVTRGLPYVLLKAAVTLDGRMASRTGNSKWITGPTARAEAHRLRSQCDAVMVGIGTVLADDPTLNVRGVRGRDPIRVVLDSRLRIPEQARLLHVSSPAATWILHGPKAPVRRRTRLMRLPGVELLEVPAADGGLDLAQALRALAARGIVRLLVEGGPTLHGALLGQELADEAAIFVAPKILGDAQAKPLAHVGRVDTIAGGWHIVSPVLRNLGHDVLIRGPLARGGD